MTTISVVIPSYNDASFLEVCLAALAVQTRPPDEIIVVDNACTDTTAAVASAAGARVIVESAHGIWPAAAAGYDAANGEVIARLPTCQGWVRPVAQSKSAVWCRARTGSPRSCPAHR